ncbi:unnamed protein product [Trifolium pratense]|uniref:Uncharacterized protein n=1 Tax=Trifolium pratense TaxID=57577 RepID=A0ACB0L1E8_TRIPR|nr:unnamed protein product [Trifolium pratense]
MESFLCDLAKPYVEKLINGAIAEARHVLCFTCTVKDFEEARAALEPDRITIEQRVKDARERNKDILGVERYSSQYYISFKSREEKYKELLNALKDDNNYITGLQGMGGTGKTTLAIKVGKDLKQSKHFAYVVDTTVSFTPDVKKIQDDIAGPLGLKWEDCNESDRHKKLWSRLTNGDKILVILDDVWDQGPPLDFEAIGIPKQGNHEGCRVLVTSRSKETFNKMDCDKIKIIELDLLSEEEAWIMFKRYAGIGDSYPKKLIDKGHKIANECKQLPIAISVIASSLKGQFQQNREHELDVTLNSLKKPVSMHGVDDDMVGIYKCLKFSYDNLKEETFKGLFLLCSVFREDEEYSIEVLTRLSIGVGLFGEDCDTYNEARNQVVRAKNKLVDSCLLLEVNKKRLKMHDLVRGAAQWIGNKEIQCVKLFDKKQKSLVENQKNIKHLLCEGKYMDFFNLKFDGSKLVTLIVKVDGEEEDECIKVPNSFFKNVTNLRVLHFSSNYQQPLSLSDSIQPLTNIRSVFVDNVDLGDISILGNLQCLETLDLVECTINELPDQITELRKLKLLKLKCCEIRKNNPFEVIKRCSSLEELYFKYSFNDFCKEITLPELQSYRIYYGGRSFFSTERSLGFLKSVVFYGDGKCQFSEETLKYCMQTADSLWLQEIKGEWRNLMPEIVPVDLGMNDLVDLRLRRISQLRCLIDTIGSQKPNVLSNLVVLELKGMEHLQILFKGKLNLCYLKTIKLENCPMLVSLFEVSTSLSLVLLETLKIANCEELKTITANERREDEEIDDSGNNKSHGSVFSKLKVIDIEECHRLESVLPFLSAQGLPVLETIRIRKCDGLKYVFGKSQHVDLISLSQLELSELPNFIDIFEECKHPMSSCVNGSSSTSKAEIQLDPIKCNTFSWWTRICCHTTIPLVDVDRDQPHEYLVASESNSHRLNKWEHAQYIPIQSSMLCNIKEIVLTHFSKMKSVINLSFVPIMLLETLKIRNCDELRHIIVDVGDHNTGGNNWVNVFPKLKKLSVKDCAQLEYIFGPGAESPETNDHHQDMEVELHFPELTQLELLNLPSLIDMCPKQYRTTFPSLENLQLKKCSQVDIKSIGDFIIHSVSESLDNTIITDARQLEITLQDIKLYDLPMMTCLFVGPKNSFALKNLTDIRIVRCDILKIAFSTSILRFLPLLLYLRIEECKELEHIIEDDLENKKKSTTCFPKLEGLAVIKCNKLKFVLPFSVCKELPNLNVLMITEANELEEIFKSEDDQKVDIPNLKIVAFDMLPSLRNTQGNQFQAVKNRFVRECKKLTLTSVLTTTSFTKFMSLIPGFNLSSQDLYMDTKPRSASECAMEAALLFKLAGMFGTQIPTNADELLYKEWFEKEGTTNANNDQVNSNVKEQFPSMPSKPSPNPSITSPTASQFPSMPSKGDPSQKVEDLAILPTNSKIQMKQTPETEHEFVENVPDLAILPTKSGELQNEQSLGETDTTFQSSQLEGSTSEKTAVATVSTISGTKNEPPIQKGIEIEGTSKTNNDQVSRNDVAFMKVTSNVEEQFSIPSRFPSTHSKGGPSQKVEDLSSSLLVKRELEELVSKNHLDYQNLPLLTDFLVKNPSVHLKDTSLPNRYKGCAYNLLAELLKFLETHSLVEVSGSRHSEFVELLQDARYFAFDKEWLDGVERRALFPEIQVSPNALEKLLHSKKQVTKDVEDLRFKIHILSQHVEDLKHQLISSEAVLESIIQQEAVLSAPIGY